MSEEKHDIDPCEGKTAEEITEYYERRGGKVDTTFEKCPFVDWNEVTHIKGLVGKPKTIKSKYPGINDDYKQEVVQVGEYMVNCSGMLRDLGCKEGGIVAIIRSDEQFEATTGKYWAFTVIDIVAQEDR